MENLARSRVVVFVTWVACGLAAIAFVACTYDPVKLPAGAGGNGATQGGSSSVVTGGSSNNGGQVNSGGAMVSGGVGNPGGGEGNMSGAGGGGPQLPVN